MEGRIIVIGRMDHTIDNTLESANRVYSVDGISPTIPTCCGGGHEPKILEEKQMETVKIRQATKDGYAECEIGGVADLNFPSSTTRRGRVVENGTVSPTLQTDGGICRIEKVGQISNDGSQYGTVVDEGGLAPTLSAGTHGYANSCIKQKYKIRKLIPLETFRLMNFDDEDFYAAESVNSDTQLYKESGNSIVVACLCAIFSQLNIKGVNAWNDMSEAEKRALTEVRRCDNPNYERKPL